MKAGKEDQFDQYKVLYKKNLYNLPKRIGESLPGFLHWLPFYSGYARQLKLRKYIRILPVILSGYSYWVELA
jgi:hypothetical protein